jgi:sugar fermentation stimulation protein A
MATGQGSGQHTIVRVPLSTGAPLVEANFAARSGQFLVEAQMGGRMVRAHLADRGRLIDLLVPGARLLLAPREEVGRMVIWFHLIANYPIAWLPRLCHSVRSHSLPVIHVCSVMCNWVPIASIFA